MENINTAASEAAPPNTSQPIPEGMCQCGCGLPTTISVKTCRRWNRVRNEPIKYRVGHNKVKPVKWRVDPDTGCWIWLLSQAKGYGTYRGTSAHRYWFEQLTGETVPAGCVAHHKCRRKLCVNPAHLEILPPKAHSERHRLDDSVTNVIRSKVEEITAALNIPIAAVRMVVSGMIRQGQEMVTE